MRILTRSQMRQLMDMATCIRMNRLAFEAVAAKRAVVPVKHHIHVEGHPDAVSLFMPGYLPDLEALGMKIVSVFPDNAQRGLETTVGTMMLVDVHGGSPKAVMDATWLTSIRTGAGSGVATDVLARPDSHTLTVIGAGGMAFHQIEAVMHVRPIRRIMLWNRTRARAEALARAVADYGWGEGRRPQVEVADDLPQAVAEADVIVACTRAREPVLRGEWVRPGTHINLVGAHEPTMREGDDALLLKSAVRAVDAWDSAAVSGEIALPVKAGTVGPEHFVELGAIALGRQPGRRTDDDITWFKSVGLAAQDMACAAEILRRAEEKNVGAVLRLDA